MKKTVFWLNKTLLNEFKEELKKGEISSISADSDMAIIAILGRHNYSLEKAIGGLRKNRIWLHLISNSISGEHISLVVDNKNLKKAVNVVHNEVFGVIKTLNVFCIWKRNCRRQVFRPARTHITGNRREKRIENSTGRSG